MLQCPKGLMLAVRDGQIRVSAILFWEIWVLVF